MNQIKRIMAIDPWQIKSDTLEIEDRRQQESLTANEEIILDELSVKNYDEYKKVAKFYTKEYNNLNDEVRDSKKTYSKNDLNDFKNKLERLLNSI